MFYRLLIASLVFFASSNAHAQSFLCASGVLYKPDGNQVYVGQSGCESAKLFGKMACVAGTIYLANGQSHYIGIDACPSAKVSPSFICAQYFLFHVSGWQQYVGTGCSGAILADDFACVSGSLYRGDGSVTYVGSQGCQGIFPK